MALHAARLHVDVRGLRGRGGGHARLLYVPLVAALGQGALPVAGPARVHTPVVRARRRALGHSRLFQGASARWQCLSAHIACGSTRWQLGVLYLCITLLALLLSVSLVRATVYALVWVLFGKNFWLIPNLYSEEVCPRVARPRSAAPQRPLEKRPP